MNLDHLARQSYKDNSSSVVYWVVLASYVYYCKYESILTDEVFDKLCKLILDKKIKHKLLSHLVNDSRMTAGTLYDVKATEYPDFIIEDAEKLLRYNIWYGREVNG